MRTAAIFLLAIYTLELVYRFTFILLWAPEPWHILGFVLPALALLGSAMILPLREYYEVDQ